MSDKGLGARVQAGFALSMPRTSRLLRTCPRSHDRVAAEENARRRDIFDSVSCGLNCLLEKGAVLPRRRACQGGNSSTGDRLLNPPVNNSGDPAPLASEALAWVIRLHSGAATSDDAKVLAQWRGIDPEHETAFRDAIKLWRTFGAAARTLVPSRRNAEP